MSLIIGYVTPVRAFSSDAGMYMQSASGRVAEALAAHCEKVCVCARVAHHAPPAPFDAALQAVNLEWIEQPYWRTTSESLLHFFGIARAYLAVCRRSDALLVRGMCPYVAILYLCACIFRRPVCHWIVGNPVALLHLGARKGVVPDRFALVYALQDRFFTRLGRWLTNGALLCNGRELARAYDSPRTIEIVSSTVTDRDFFARTDTCLRPTSRILFVGFIRPEKGIEYLLEAVADLHAEVLWELEIVGPAEFPEYRRKLAEVAAARGIADRVHWSGYVANGEPLFARMRASDIFVLPSLSEGTPHVLVEARANGLPCIATRVGGVPTTVTDRYDALLVPPRDAPALTKSITAVIRDGELRRGLIANGRSAARLQTLDRFIHIALRELLAGSHAETTAIRKCRKDQMRILQYLWFHFITVATGWMPDLRPVTRLRGFLLRPSFQSCGANLQVARRVTINFTNRVEIGRDVFLGMGCWLQGEGGILLEDEVQLGPYAVLAAGDHTALDGSYRRGKCNFAPIRVCRGSWVAAHATVTRGVTIGAGSLLAANSVATHDVPPFAVAAGVPARAVGNVSRMEVVR